MTKRNVLILGLVASLTAPVYQSCNDGKVANGAVAQEAGGNDEDVQGKKGKKKGGKKKGDIGDPGVSILQQWDMPPALKEISGIALTADNRFACVQDEEGKIFLYNTATSQVDKKIPFGGPGDYEGIAIVGTTAYVLRADGLIFEVRDFAGGKPTVAEYRTPLTVQQDLEGLCKDPKNNRLLLSVKGKDPTSTTYKGVYAFDLASKKLLPAPVYKIGLTDAGSKKGKGSVQPSDIEVHPRTGDLYVLDGPGSGLIILGADGTEKSRYALGSADFPQPEGIAITQSGDLYISNEGRKGYGTILKVSLDAQP